MLISYLLESVGRTGGNIVLFKHMDSLVASGHEVYAVTPYSCTTWLELKKSLSAPNSGYQGTWGILKMLQLKLRKKYPAIEKKLSDWIRPNAASRSRWITKRLIKFCPTSDIVIATHSLTAFAAAEIKEKSGSQAYHHMQGYEPWFSDDKRISEIIKPVYRLDLKRIANCSWLADQVTKEHSPILGLVFPGVDQSIFNIQTVSAPESIFKIEDSSPIKILSYCDPRPLKGWHESVLAMSNVFERIDKSKRIEWHVFGHGNFTKIDVPVRHHGFLSHAELADLYRSCDLLFLPSWFESFPLQPLEAMACGVAVITTRIGTEDFAFNEQTALVVEPKAPDQLADAILRLINDAPLRKNLSIQGSKIASEFTWERSSQQLINILGASNLHHCDVPLIKK